MLHRDRKWLTEKKLLVSVTENSEEVTVKQEAAKYLSQASTCACLIACGQTAQTISVPVVRVNLLTSPRSALWV